MLVGVTFHVMIQFKRTILHIHFMTNLQMNTYLIIQFRQVLLKIH